MNLMDFYAVLATTASMFVGILTAYLIIRLCDIKSQRAQIFQRIESIDSELKSLILRRDFNEKKLEETKREWKKDKAKEDVDCFIKWKVGRDWNPHPDHIEINDAVEALIEHQDLTEDDVIKHHREVLDNRWEEIENKLEPTSGIFNDIPVSTEGKWVVDALWKIYEQEKYDTRHFQTGSLQRKIKTKKEQRNVLEEQHSAHDPEKLYNIILIMVIPIILNVVIPLAVIFAHQIGFTLQVQEKYLIIEPIMVFVSWILGLCITLGFLYIQLLDSDEKLPEAPE